MNYSEYRDLVYEDLKRFDSNIGSVGVMKRLFVLYKTRIRYDSFAVVYWFRTMQYYNSKSGVLNKIIALIAKIKYFYKRRQTGIQIPMSAQLGGEYYSVIFHV